MSQYWLCSVCISVVDSFSSHCVAFNEPGNKAVGQKQKQKLFQKWGYLGKGKLLDRSKIYFAPPFQPQVGVFFLHVIFQIELNQSSKVAATTFEILCFPVSSSQMFQLRVLNWLLSNVTKLPEPQGFLTEVTSPKTRSSLQCSVIRHVVPQGHPRHKRFVAWFTNPGPQNVLSSVTKHLFLRAPHGEMY